MSVPELIYKLAEFFFGDFIHYTAMLILIMVIRGDLVKFVSKVKTFIKDVLSRYQAKAQSKAQWQKNIPKEVKTILDSQQQDSPYLRRQKAAYQEVEDSTYKRENSGKDENKGT